MYKLDYLIEILCTHSKNHETNKKINFENSESSELYLNLPEALKTICKEIKELKEKQ